MSVRRWPGYLLRDMPDYIRAQVELDADLDGCALIEVIRSILCAHYGLDCPPVESSERDNESGTTTMFLRLQPELMDAIRAQAGLDERKHGATQRVILGILSAHYNGG